MKLLPRIAEIVDFSDILVLAGVTLLSLFAHDLHPAGAKLVWGAFLFWVGAHEPPARPRGSG